MYVNKSLAVNSKHTETNQALTAKTSLHFVFKHDVGTAGWFLPENLRLCTGWEQQFEYVCIYTYKIHTCMCVFVKYTPVCVYFVCRGIHHKTTFTSDTDPHQEFRM